MKKHFLYLLVSIFIFSCAGNKEEKVVEKKYPNGKPEIEKYYSKDENDNRYLSKEVTYWPNSEKKIEGTYNKEQNRDGYWVAYHENGNKWSEGSYVDGVDDGRKTVWYENGQIYYQGNYKMGKQAGVWKFYDENGVLIREEDYGDRD